MKNESATRRWVRPCTLVYLSLLGLTVVTYWIGQSGLSGLPVALGTLALALLKGHLVGDWFMGLRGLTSFWRWVVLVWLFVPGALITAAFVMAAGA